MSVPAPKYNYALGYLRAFLVVLVVAHHATLAYYPANLPPHTSLVSKPRWWELFPVMDAHKWSGAVQFVGFNDTFFMALLFFLSGLFVWQGLKRKGSMRFLRERALKLGVPFLVAAALVAPLAYYPAYLQIAKPADGFWHQWLSLGQWPSGPAWFVWVLLAFDAIAAFLFSIASGLSERLCRTTSNVSDKPVVFFAVLVAVSAVAYLPMAGYFSPLAWATFGPFTFQTSRILHYLVYFLMGVGIGACGVERGLLAPDGKLARRWLLWLTVALVVYEADAYTQTQRWDAAGDCAFVLSCAATSIAFLALFLRFARTKSRLADGLSANSYAIYLVHYAFVSWLQYALLPASFPGYAKAVLVSFGALALSWGAAVLLRRIPGVAQVL